MTTALAIYLTGLGASLWSSRLDWQDMTRPERAAVVAIVAAWPVTLPIALALRWCGRRRARR